MQHRRDFEIEIEIEGDALRHGAERLLIAALEAGGGVADIVRRGRGGGAAEDGALTCQTAVAELRE